MQSSVCSPSEGGVVAQSESGRVRLLSYSAAHVELYHKWLSDPWIREMTQTEQVSLSAEYAWQREVSRDPSKHVLIIAECADSAVFLCGDVDVFLRSDSDGSAHWTAELNVMIAEDSARRKGLATEAVRTAMRWAQHCLPHCISVFEAKISAANAPSIALFSKLGFVQTDFVEAFNEYTFELKCQK